MLSSTETINYKQLVETINKAIFGDSSRETTREDTGVNTINEEKTTSSIDNSVKSSEQFIRENYQKRYLQLVYQDSFYPEESNNSIQFIGQLKGIYGNTVLANWFISMYNENVGDPVILKGLLYTILYYSDCFGDLVELSAQAALSHSSKEINELGVRILESQCNEKHYNILCNIKGRENWLQNYIEEVKKDFKKELCLY
jgi:hypothetical protein